MIKQNDIDDNDNTVCYASLASSSSSLRRALDLSTVLSFMERRLRQKSLLLALATLTDSPNDFQIDSLVDIHFDSEIDFPFRFTSITHDSLNDFQIDSLTDFHFDSEIDFHFDSATIVYLYSQNLVKDLYTRAQLLLARACLELVMADESNSSTLSSREVEKAVGVIRALVTSVPKSTSEEAGESSTGNWTPKQLWILGMCRANVAGHEHKITGIEVSL